MKNRRRGNTGDERLLINNLRKQRPLNTIPTIPVEPPRQERKEEDNASSTQCLSNQGSHVTRAVSRQ
ncbi:hypothetical protein ACH5RR_025841 [Cinchona calisaya]|uniref:Uncharacterized protein n=1 Tax=Cinchona calisaya TaxID=153742 RepID=A0ABD2Z1W3_9GENT